MGSRTPSPFRKEIESHSSSSRKEHHSRSPAPDMKRDSKKNKRQELAKEVDESTLDKSIKKRKSSPSPTKKKRKMSESSGSEDSDVAESDSDQSSVESTPEKKKKK